MAFATRSLRREEEERRAREAPASSHRTRQSVRGSAGAADPGNSISRRGRAPRLLTSFTLVIFQPTPFASAIARLKTPSFSSAPYTRDSTPTDNINMEDTSTYFPNGNESSDS